MRFSCRSFWIAKDAEYPDEYQDAFAMDPDRGVAAVADGVTSGIFSGAWARILTQAVVANPGVVDEPGRFEAWLDCQRAIWRERIDVANLPWNLRAKLIDGATTTLLWLELCPPEAREEDGIAEGPAAVPRPYLLRAGAIGDCCLFHLRGEELISSFPINQSEAFGLDPAVLRSTPSLPDKDAIQRCQYDCLPGDLLILTTDALALWAIQRYEAGDGVPWRDFWDLPDEEWCCRIADLRRQKSLRYDDTTLVLLQVLEEHATAPPELNLSTEDSSPCLPDQN